jgi:ADP-ribose pyrophosphatase
MGKSTLKPWEIVNSREVFVAEPWIRVLEQEVRLPNGNVIRDYHQIRLPEYVIVFAQTTDGRVIIERQYKHGLGKVSLTLPAGVIGDGEQPLAAAQRELLEETGYQCNNWETLGSFATHGSYGCGRAHIFMARNARRVAEPNSGDLEEMEITLMSPNQLGDAVRRGQFELLGSVAVIAMATNPLICSKPV